MQESESQSTETTAQRWVLVVDDEAPIREVLKSHLAKQGFHVAAVATEAETLKLVRSQPIDLVILDVVLEDSDGLDLLEKLKRVRPRCPVIIITGLAEDEAVKRQALQKGAAECISKVCPLDELSASIERTLSSMPPPLRRGQSDAPRRARRSSGSRTGLLPKPNRRIGTSVEGPPRVTSPGPSFVDKAAATTLLVESAAVSIAVTEAQNRAAAPPEATVAQLHEALAVVPATDAPVAAPGSVAALVTVLPEAERFHASVEVFLKMLQAYHPNLANTAMRAVFLCRTLGELLHFQPMQLQNLLWSAALHDISLVQFDRQLLNRWLRGTEKCTKQEAALLRRHPERSQRMLDFCPAFKEAGEIILAHHENWDGSGYPGKLRMEMIPWLARLLSIVIFYCSKHAPTEKTLVEIQTQANQLYDPRAVAAVVKAAALTTLPRGEREMIASALKPGMVLAGDVVNWKGVLIIGQETELNQSRITRIIHLAEIGQIESRVLVWA